MRGKIISYCSHKKKEQPTREQYLQAELKKLDLITSQEPSILNTKELLKTKMELSSMLNKKTEKTRIKLRQQQFELGDKTWKYLVNQLKQQTEKYLITSIIDS